jgi:predicted amidohydrolase
MSERLTVGLIQMNGGVEPGPNLDALEAGAREAAGRGASLVLAPEAANIVQRDGARLREAVRSPQDDPALPRLASLAAELEVWLVAGSLMVLADDGRVANRCHVFSPDGRLAAVYDKIHLFDIDFGDGESYAESDNVRPGDAAVIVPTPWGRLGLSVCYDLRFPALYRQLAQAGATMFAVPSAFTRRTGEAHWETLLRARAIENGAFVFAPAQGGRHEDGRATWGRSMIVGPWGEVIAKLDHDRPGVLTAAIDMGAVAAARKNIPSLSHDRAFAAQ